MTSPLPDPTPVALFLFAHQDDEFGAFQAILDCQRQGRRVLCAFLTEGRRHSRLAARRDKESRRVLCSLGVAVDDIIFAGTLLAIADAALPEHLARAASWLRSWMKAFSRIELMCIPAWEGGHHDHDALHALAAQVAHELKVLERVRQYALYHGQRRIWPFMRVLAPLPANGAVEQQVITWRNRLRFLGLCLCYPSQIKVWSGLFPLVLRHYLCFGVQTLQGVALARIAHKPHEGLLHYERKQLYTWHKMQQNIYVWQQPTA